MRNPKEHSTHIISIRLTPTELHALQEVADAEKRTLSDAARIRIFGMPLPPVPIMQDSGPVEVR